MITIENTIIKIGGLLAVSFGEAGGLIIARNFSGIENDQNQGKNIVAIFGFCDIRNFTDATEILQGDVMQFVNSIAEVVHSEVDLYLGAANKNIGDAFLLVWRAPTFMVYEDNNILTLKKNNESQKLCDFALFSIIKIIIKLNTEPKILSYRENKALNQRMPNYKIKLGFGLHQGWAIEGAIGSRFKIDASYLSPHVNISSSLEAATKSYGALILLSQDVYEYMSEPMKKICRQVDNVFLNGQIKGIFTVDLNVDLLKNDLKPAKFLKIKQKQQKHNQKKIKIKDLFLQENFDIQIFLQNLKVSKILPQTNLPFYTYFKQGIDSFIEGKWTQSYEAFLQCQNLDSEDIPTQNLLNYIQEFNKTAPQDWKGYRTFD